MLLQIGLIRRSRRTTRAALLGALCVTALASQPAIAELNGDPHSFFDRRDAVADDAPQPAKAHARARDKSRASRHDAAAHASKHDRAERRDSKPDKKPNKEAHPLEAPAGPLAIVVSIAKQRVTVFSDGKEVAAAPVSSGMAGHETPLGVFAIIGKERHHASNIYSGAPMPYMQRITWSGVALHEGVLPGRPASHGCIRLPGSFASHLFGFTKVGARVVVTRDPVAPVEFSSTRLFVPKKPQDEPVSTGSVATVTTADANPGAKSDIKPDAKPEKKAEPVKRKGPVSVFVSRKTGRLYVRQDFKPVFDMPVAIAEPDKPWGTHVFTAMEIKDDQVRWTALTIPSGYASKAEGRHASKLSARETERRAKLAADLASAPTPDVALARFEMPQDAVTRIDALLNAGSSLIVSDNGPSEETGVDTDFVVATP